MEKMSSLTVSPEYSALLTKVSPKIVRTEKENDAYTEILYDLDQRSKKLTPAERELAKLLTLLIEDFEERRYRLPGSKPLDVLQFLLNGRARLRAHPGFNDSRSASQATLNVSYLGQ